MAEELVLDRVKKKTVKKRKEKMWHVIFFNDEYTQYHFVVACLMCVFGKSQHEAKEITEAIQRQKQLIVGTYSLEEADARAKMVENLKVDECFLSALNIYEPQPLVVLLREAE